MSDIRFDQARRRRFDAQTGKDREEEHRRDRALARRTAIGPAKARQREALRQAMLRRAREADRWFAAERRGFAL